MAPVLIQSYLFNHVTFSPYVTLIPPKIWINPVNSGDPPHDAGEALQGNLVHVGGLQAQQRVLYHPVSPLDQLNLVIQISLRSCSCPEAPGAAASSLSSSQST